MPFIHDDPDLRVKGRREFKKGREVSAADPVRDGVCPLLLCESDHEIDY